MALTHQPSLLDLADTAQLARPLTDATRTELAGGAWVDHLPAWVVGSDEVLDAAARATSRGAPSAGRCTTGSSTCPRLLASYAEDEPLPHPVLRPTRGALSAHYAPELGEPFADRGLLPLPRRARQRRLARRHDRPRRYRGHHGRHRVVRRTRARCCCARAAAAQSLRFALGHGDLLVMGGSCQRTWEHAVPKSAAPAGPRVSVQFRPAGVA